MMHLYFTNIDMVTEPQSSAPCHTTQNHDALD